MFTYLLNIIINQTVGNLKKQKTYPYNPYVLANKNVW